MDNKNIENMKTQLKILGLSIDWDLEVSTCDKSYYRHQQEIFMVSIMALFHEKKLMSIGTL